MQSLTQFASETTGGGNIFSSLGIDWQMLILQLVGFLLLIFLLSKWVYPWLMKSVDERQGKIEAAAKMAAEAQEQASKAEEKTAELLEEARKEAADIVNTARKESAAALSESEEKARTQAERIVSEAHEQIDKDIIAAKKALYNETLDLVASATGTLTGSVMDAKKNEAVITKAVKEAK